MVLIAPSILSADYGNLAEEVQKLETAGADMIHMDIMDGHFVPNISFGPSIVKALRKYSKIPFDVHLMVNKPEEVIPWFSDVGANIITIHAEAAKHLDAALRQIRGYGMQAGVSLNPETDENEIKYVLDNVDLILIMSVNPGFGGQKFIETQIKKIQACRKMIKGRPIRIEVDGGITSQTGALCKRAGADILVAGTSIFQGGNYKENIKALRGK